jgi:hypothetical protein
MVEILIQILTDKKIIDPDLNPHKLNRIRDLDMKYRENVYQDSKHRYRYRYSPSTVPHKIKYRTCCITARTIFHDLT